MLCCSVPLLVQGLLSGEADGFPVALADHDIIVELSEVWEEATGDEIETYGLDPEIEAEIFFEAHADCATALRSDGADDEDGYVGPIDDDDIEAVAWLPATFHPQVWLEYGVSDDIHRIVACATIGTGQLIVVSELLPDQPLAALPPPELVEMLVRVREAFVAREAGGAAAEAPVAHVEAVPPPVYDESPAAPEPAPYAADPAPYAADPAPYLPPPDVDDPAPAGPRATIAGTRIELGMHQLTPVTLGVEEIASPGGTIALVAPPRIRKHGGRGLATVKHLRGGFSAEHGLLGDAGVGIGYGISGRSLGGYALATIGVDYIGGNDEMMFDPDLGAYYGYMFAWRFGNDDLGFGLDLVGELVSHGKHIDERRVDVRLGTNKLARRAWTVGLQYRGYDDQASLLGVTLGMGY
jgi:hypothetical protein